MKSGNWVPVSKTLVKFLPLNRAYTKLEAMYCIQCDYDNEQAVSVTGYATLWQWSKTKVKTFLSDAGVMISYAQDTKKKPNQKGLIEVQSESNQNLIRFIDNRDLQPKESNEIPIGVQSESSTIETNTNTEEIYLSIPLKDNGSRHDITLSDLKEYTAVFTRIPVDYELRKLRQWNVDNPRKRKTARGIRKHISGWLTRANDKAQPKTEAPQPHRPDDSWRRKIPEIYERGGK